MKTGFFFVLLILLLAPPATSAFGKKGPPKKKEHSKYGPARADNSSTPDARSLIQQAEILKNKNPSAAIERLEQALKISIEEKNSSNEAHCYRVLALINLQNGLYEQALRQAQKAEQLFTAVKDPEGTQMTRFVLGEAYLANHQPENALNSFTAYSETATLQQKPQETIRALYKVAEIQRSLGKDELALAHYETILALEKEQKNQEGIVEANKKIGELYQSRNQKKRALKYYKDAQDIADKGNDAKTYSEINKNISEVVSKDEAIDLQKMSLEKSQQARNPEIENKENLALGNSYLEKQESETAIPYLQRSVTLSGKLGKLEDKGAALKSLSEAYTQQRRFEKAMHTMQQYLAIKDTLIRQKERQINRMLSTNIALTEQQQKIAFLEKDVELSRQTIASLAHEQSAREERLAKQRVLIYSLALGIAVIALASWLVYKNARKRRIANQLLALKSLRSQMNPHFIFNALNSVNSFISKNDERSANKYLADFSRLMRMVMENSQHDFVPLHQEIAILRLYLGLEHFRFPEKFDYTFTVSEELDTEAVEIPPMLLQPYIENAIWHGLRYKTEKGLLEVTIGLSAEKTMEVTIRDNGIGRKKSAELKTANQKTASSTGLKNTAGRIELINELYGKNIRLAISDAAPQAEDVGTVVIIHLPKVSQRYSTTPA